MVWENKSFGDCAELIGDTVQPSETLGLPYIGLEHISQGQLSLLGFGKSDDVISAKSKFRKGDILFGKLRPYFRKVIIAPFDGLCSTDIWVVRAKSGTDQRYLYYWMASEEFVETASRASEGTKMPRAQWEFVEQIQQELPDEPEQRAIAGILGALDDKIELNRRMNATLEGMARAVFRRWFSENEESKDWQVQMLEQHIEAEKGLSYKGEGLAKDSGTPMHNLNSVYEGGGYKYEGIKFYAGEYRERHILHAGDIIVTNTEQGFEYLLIGYPAIVPKYFGETGIFSHHIFRVRPLPTSPLKTHYLYFLLMDPFVRDQIIGCTNGTTVNMLSADGLRTPKFRLPPKELIDQFELFATPIFEKKELLYKESRTLEILRDTLLPKLMRGEVRVRRP
jgi:type I restriction enzyme S subunit